MNDEQVATLVSRAQAGNEHSLDVLFYKFTPFRHGLASRYTDRGVEMDDMIQQIDMLFIQAVLEYDATKDSSPTRHIVASTRQRTYVYYRDEHHHRMRHVPNGLDLREFREDDALADVDMRDYLARTLTNEEMQIITLLEEGYWQYEVADKLGISASTVSRILTQAKEKINFFRNL